MLECIVQFIIFNIPIKHKFFLYCTSLYCMYNFAHNITILLWSNTPTFPLLTQSIWRSCMIIWSSFWNLSCISTTSWDFKAIGLIICMQAVFMIYYCFLCLYDSWAVSRPYKENWGLGALCQRSCSGHEKGASSSSSYQAWSSEDPGQKWCCLSTPVHCIPSS